MTNEELAAAIQAGETGRVPELWDQVRNFAWKQAKRWALALDGRGGVTAEDLAQSGFLALMDAVDSFAPERGMSFIGWYALWLKTAFTKAAGLRTKRDRADPIRLAASLDAPVDDAEEDSSTLEELVEDPRAAQSFQAIEIRQLHEAVERALLRLTEDQRAVIRCRYYQGLTLEQTARKLGMCKGTVTSTERKALLRLRHPENNLELRRYR